MPTNVNSGPVPVAGRGSTLYKTAPVTAGPPGKPPAAPDPSASLAAQSTLSSLLATAAGNPTGRGLVDLQQAQMQGSVQASLDGTVVEVSASEMHHLIQKMA